MKLDPDERLSEELKNSLSEVIKSEGAEAYSMGLRLGFMGRPLPVRWTTLVRVWRTGRCRFSDTNVNEYPIIDGCVAQIKGDIEHHNSPDLEH